MLGSDFDLGIGIAPVDLTTAANTGLRQYMGNIDYLTVLFIGGAGGSAQPPVLTLRQHTASSSGTSSNLASVTEVWTKSGATLANTETWTRTAQAASQTVTGTAAVQQVIAFKVQPEDLAAGCSYISVDVADPGAASMLGCLVYVLSGFSPRTVPASLPAALR